MPCTLSGRTAALPFPSPLASFSFGVSPPCRRGGMIQPFFLPRLFVPVFISSSYCCISPVFRGMCFNILLVIPSWPGALSVLILYTGRKFCSPFNYFLNEKMHILLEMAVALLVPQLLLCPLMTQKEAKKRYDLSIYKFKK